VEGWRPVEEAVEWGFAQKPVVVANEAHHGPARDVPGPITTLPDDERGYLAQPEMRAMIGTVLGLGWTLWAYEDQIEITPDTDRAWLRSMEYTNMREREQAANLCRLLEAAPGEPMLVWCGNSHASELTEDGA
jgi:hypothetical protein